MLDIIWSNLRLCIGCIFLPLKWKKYIRTFQPSVLSVQVIEELYLTFSFNAENYSFFGIICLIFWPKPLAGRSHVPPLQHCSGCLNRDGQGTRQRRRLCQWLHLWLESWYFSAGSLINLLPSKCGWENLEMYSIWRKSGLPCLTERECFIRFGNQSLAWWINLSEMYSVLTFIYAVLPPCWLAVHLLLCSLEGGCCILSNYKINKNILEKKKKKATAHSTSVIALINPQWAVKLEHS